MNKYRFRNVFLALGISLTMLLLIITDPDLGLVQNMKIGAGTITSLTFLFKGILGSSLLYITRKAMFDYEEANIQELLRNARRTPEGAGYAVISIALQTIAYAIVIVGAFNV